MEVIVPLKPSLDAQIDELFQIVMSCSYNVVQGLYLRLGDFFEKKEKK
jgi:hypothetical protein